MKRAYNAPKLTVHGNVEEITKSFGNPGANDTFQNARGETFPGSLINQSGSQNGVVVPTRP
jgi:hypothetical protein